MVDIGLTAANSTTTVGGVIFQDVDNIGSGSGGYNPFLAIRDNDGNEAGFNTDTGANEVSNPNIDNSKTNAVLLGSADDWQSLPFAHQPSCGPERVNEGSYKSSLVLGAAAFGRGLCAFELDSEGN